MEEALNVDAEGCLGFSLHVGDYESILAHVRRGAFHHVKAKFCSCAADFILHWHFLHFLNETHETNYSLRNVTSGLY